MRLSRPDSVLSDFGALQITYLLTYLSHPGMLIVLLFSVQRQCLFMCLSVCLSTR